MKVMSDDRDGFRILQDTFERKCKQRKARQGGNRRDEDEATSDEDVCVEREIFSVINRVREHEFCI